MAKKSCAEIAFNDNIGTIEYNDDDNRNDGAFFFLVPSVMTGWNQFLLDATWTLGKHMRT